MLKRAILFSLSLSLLITALFVWAPREPGVVSSGKSPRVGELAERKIPATPFGDPVVARQQGTEDVGVVPGAKPESPDDAVAETGEDALASFARWTDEYIDEAASGARSEMEERGAVLAMERREIMKQLIRDDPRSAIANATPPHVREQLPAAVLSQLEEPVSGRGAFDVYGIVPDREKGIPQRLVERKFRMESESYDAFVYGRMEGIQTVRDFFVHGIAIDRDLAVDERPVRVVGQVEASALEETPSAYSVEETPHDETVAVTVETRKGYYTLCCQGHLAAYGANELDSNLEFEAAAIGDAVPTMGKANILVMLAVFPEDSERPNVSEMVVSRQQASQTMARVSNYFLESSYRQFSFDGIDVTNELVLPEEWGWYLEEDEEGVAPGPDAILAHARETAQEEGYFLDYDFAIVVFPGIGFPWAGLGFVGAKGAWAQGNFSEVVVAHELGHNLGLWHANYWEPSGPERGSYPFRSGRALEYGNPFDVMGGGGLQSGHFSGNFKSQLGWIPEANMHEILEEETAGIYRLHRLDGGMLLYPETMHTLRIGLTEEQQPLAYGEEPGDQVSYWIDFRQLFLGNARTSDGVVVQWGQATSMGSRLLNMDSNAEAWPPPVARSALMTGETFYDRSAEVLITPLIKGGVAPSEYIDVAVTRGQLEVEIIDPLAVFSVVNPGGELLVGPHEELAVRVEASGTGSPVAGVDFLVEGQKVGSFVPTEIEGEYEINHVFSSFGTGNFTVEARAYNENGNFVLSEPLEFNVSSIGLDLTVSRDSMPLGETVSLEAIRRPGQPDFEEVFFFAGEEQLTVSGEPPYQVDWTPSATGIFSLRAIAYDSEGEEILSEGVELTVHSLILKVSAERVNPGQSVQLDLNVLLREDDFEFVDFFADGQLIRRALESPYRADWVSLETGEYELTVVARGSGRNIDISPTPITISVVAPVSPALRLWPQQAPETPEHLNDVTFADGRFVAVGRDGTARASTDGMEWMPSPTGATVALNGVARGLGGYIAVGDEGVAVYSTEGQDWSPVVTQTGERISALAFGDGVFVAVGDGGRIRTLTTPEGPWIAQTSGTDANLRDVAYGGGTFVAVGDGGTILRSENGFSWTASDSPTAAHLRGVTYGDSQFVTVGGAWDEELAMYQAVILTSSTGVTWSTRDPGLLHILHGVAFGDGEFVAVGGGGSLSVSADGIGWMDQSTLVTTTLMGVAYGDGEFVAVGRNGTVVRSGAVNAQNWLDQHFSSEEMNDPEIGTFGADPGNFGIPNLMRYALGLNPGHPERQGLPEMVIWEDGSDFYPAVTFTKLAAVDDVRFVLETSSDLSSWDVVTGTEVVPSVPVDGKEMILMRGTTPFGSEQNVGFFRLRAELVE